MSEDTLYICGIVSGIIYKNEGKSFYIFRLRQDEDQKTVIVRGNITGMLLEVGAWIGLEGVWEKHPKHGRQVKILKAPAIQGGWTTDRIVKVLASRGQSRIALSSLAAVFKDKLQEALEDIEMLCTAKGVTREGAEHLSGAWITARVYFETLDVLSEMGVPQRTVDAIWSYYGDDTRDVLSTNPWLMVEVPGVDFGRADGIARKMKCNPDSKFRVAGATLGVLLAAKNSGSVCISATELLGRVRTLIPDVGVGLYAEALSWLKEESKVIYDKAHGKLVYEPLLHNLEHDSAVLLTSRMQSDTFQKDVWRQKYVQQLGRIGVKTQTFGLKNPEDVAGTARAALDEWLSESKVDLSAAQFEGALRALIEPLSILTGGPGTGKTFTLKTVVSILQEAEVPLLLTAPTGIAAKRIQQVTGAEASTIHRAFQAQGSSDEEREATYSGIVGTADAATSSDTDTESEWGFGLGMPHAGEVLIVDETSMVDQHLLYRLMSCTSARCRVVFVGDDAQLPSVGAGNVLRDLIASEVVPTTKLTEIFRQHDTSDIVIAAHDINSGVYPKPTEGKTDFIFKEQQSEKAILSSIRVVAQKLYDAGKNFQVLSPKHRGTLGVTNLNDSLRALLNPPAAGLQEMKVLGGTLREGDRVMVIRNDYNYNIFNGDVGKVIRLDRKDSTVDVKIWGNPDLMVRMKMADVGRYLRLAYAVTINKCQGQEFDYIVMPWVDGFRHQLQRNLVYTAVTRAKEKVVIFGHGSALQKSVLTIDASIRETRLPDRLAEELEKDEPSALIEGITPEQHHRENPNL